MHPRSLRHLAQGQDLLKRALLSICTTSIVLLMLILGGGSVTSSLLAQGENNVQLFPAQGFSLVIPSGWSHLVGNQFGPHLPADTVSLGSTAEPVSVSIVSVTIGDDFPKDVTEFAKAMLRLYRGLLLDSELTVLPSHIRQPASVRLVYREPDPDAAHPRIVVSEFVRHDNQGYWLSTEYTSLQGSETPYDDRERSRLTKFEQVVSSFTLLSEDRELDTILTYQDWRKSVDWLNPSIQDRSLQSAFAWPTTGWIGWTYDRSSSHNGVDIWTTKKCNENSTERGNAVYSVGTGEVDYIYKISGGAYDGVRIKHGLVNGVNTWTHYWHLGSLNTQTGQQQSFVTAQIGPVDNQSQIGYQGNLMRNGGSGVVTTCVHVHMTVANGSADFNAIDPSPYFDVRLNKADPPSVDFFTLYVEHESSATPPPSGSEWEAAYFNGRTCWDDHTQCNDAQHTERIALSGGTVLFDKNWGRNAPGGSVGPDNWTGYFTTTVTFAPGTYVFYADHDDGLLLKAGEYEQHVKDPDARGSKICNGDGGFALSGNVPIELYLREDGGDAFLRLWWSTDTSVCVPTPTPTLTSTPAPTPTGTPTSSGTPATTPTSTGTPTSAATPTPPASDCTDWSVIGTGNAEWQCHANSVQGHSATGDSILVSRNRYADVTISADVRTTNREASLAVRMQDAGNGYIAILTPNGSSRNNGNEGLWLARRVAGSEQYLGSYHGAGLPLLGESANFTVSAVGSLIEVRLNDQIVLSIYDTMFTSGSVGLRIDGDSAFPNDASFTNISITQLNSTPTPTSTPEPTAAATPSPSGFPTPQTQNIYLPDIGKNAGS